MRLLFVGTKQGGGGAETHLVELARSLAYGGTAVGAVVRPGSYIATSLATHPDIKLYHGAFKRSSDPAGTMAVLRAARDFKPDWLVGVFKQEYYSVAVIAKATRASVAFFQHTDLPTRRLTNFALPRICDEFIVPSHYLREHLVERGMPAHRISVLHNPVDVDKLHPNGELRAEMRRKLGFSNSDVVVGYVGRVETPKGSDVLASALTIAMKQNPNVRALWVGNGRWANALAQHIEQNGETAKHVLTGWVDDATSYYAAMDVLALPSTKGETFGRASVEAQACGVPVIASRLGGIPETMLAGTTGWLLPPGDVNAWADAILRMTDASVRLDMARHAPEFVARSFAGRNIARQFLAMLAARDAKA